ncbi:hypothetical protein GW17_00007521 [Ensete ventricosum]|nr:hypothetical protein GW17_00007521 [Ensete ventricosum]
MRRHLVSWETRRRLPSPRGRQGVPSLRLMGDVAVHRLPTQEAEASPRLPARGRGRVTASSFCTGTRQHLVFQLGDEVPPRFSRETMRWHAPYGSVFHACRDARVFSHDVGASDDVIQTPWKIKRRGVGLGSNRWVPKPHLPLNVSPLSKSNSHLINFACTCLAHPHPHPPSPFRTETLRLAYPRPSLLPPTFPSSQQLFQEEEEEAKQSDSIPSRLLLCEPHCD